MPRGAVHPTNRHRSHRRTARSELATLTVAAWTHTTTYAWQPPLASYRCTYARMWVRVKYVWNLTVTSAEKSILSSTLSGC